jgi:hypothetical protein
MNNSEISTILQQFNDTWNGDPWFGKPITELLEGITEKGKRTCSHRASTA